MEKKDILIVDDMEINRVILSQIFADRNQILEAENGLEAIEIARRRRRGTQRACRRAAGYPDAGYGWISGYGTDERYGADGEDSSLSYYCRFLGREYETRVSAWSHGYY